MCGSTKGVNQCQKTLNDRMAQFYGKTPKEMKAQYGDNGGSKLGNLLAGRDKSSMGFRGNPMEDLKHYAYANHTSLEDAHKTFVENYGEANKTLGCSFSSKDSNGPKSYGDWNPTGESSSNNSTSSTECSGSDCSSSSGNSTCSSGSGQKTVTIDGHQITLTGNPDNDLSTVASTLGCSEDEAKQKLQAAKGAPTKPESK